MGLDDNWQKCGQLNGQRSFHDADGNPIIDTTKFPNMSAMTAHGKIDDENAAMLGLIPQVIPEEGTTLLLFII